MPYTPFEQRPSSQTFCIGNFYSLKCSVMTIFQTCPFHLAQSSTKGYLQLLNSEHTLLQLTFVIGAVKLNYVSLGLLPCCTSFVCASMAIRNAIVCKQQYIQFFRLATKVIVNLVCHLALSHLGDVWTRRNIKYLRNCLHPTLDSHQCTNACKCSHNCYMQGKYVYRITFSMTPSYWKKGKLISDLEKGDKVA